MLEPSLPFYAALFGAMKRGAIAVPLFTLFGPDGVRLRTQDCTPSPAADHAGEGGGARPRWTARASLPRMTRSWPRWRASRTDIEPQTAASDLAIFQYTSGTTREMPAAIKHTHRAVVVVMNAALYGTGLRPGDRFFCPSSPAWGHGLWHGTLAPLALGIETGAYAGKFDAERLLQALQDYGIDQPLGRRDALPDDEEHRARGNYRTHTAETLLHRRTDRPRNRWRSSRTRSARRCAACTARPRSASSWPTIPAPPDFVIKDGSLGRPVPGVEVEVQRPDGSRCLPDELGEIKVRRHDAWFPTKDRGRMDDDGYFYHAGRADDVIISAGWTMSAVEIEDALLRHPAVQAGRGHRRAGRAARAWWSRPSSCRSRVTRPTRRRCRASRTSCATG